jgi:hypothetical protein
MRFRMNKIVTLIKQYFIEYALLFTAPAASGSGDTDKNEKAPKGGTAVKVTTIWPFCIRIS